MCDYTRQSDAWAGSPPLPHAHRVARRPISCFFFFFNDTATTEIYTLSLHDALPIFLVVGISLAAVPALAQWQPTGLPVRSEEHTSELQSLRHLVCRLLLEKKTYTHRTRPSGQGPPSSSASTTSSRSTAASTDGRARH